MRLWDWAINLPKGAPARLLILPGQAEAGSREDPLMYQGDAVFVGFPPRVRLETREPALLCALHVSPALPLQAENTWQCVSHQIIFRSLSSSTLKNKNIQAKTMASSLSDLGGCFQKGVVLRRQSTFETMLSKINCSRKFGICEQAAWQRAAVEVPELVFIMNWYLLYLLVRACKREGREIAVSTVLQVT